MTHPTDPTVAAALERVLIGLHPEVTIDGAIAWATYEPQPEHRGAPGWVHGGFLATLLDHVGARIARSVLDARVATGTLDLRYRRPVLLDDGPYRVEGRAESVGHRTAKVRAMVLDSAGRPLTEARGLFVAVGSLSGPRDGGPHVS